MALPSNRITSQEINAYFDEINHALASYLNGHGYQAETIRATHTYDPKDTKSRWSHRSAAVIVGLASLGANRLAITAKGSDGRFCKVITSAPLEPNSIPAPHRCPYLQDGSCGLCFKACPVGALRLDGMDKFACQDEVNKNQEKLRKETNLANVDTCGKCISVYPFSYIE